MKRSLPTIVALACLVVSPSRRRWSCLVALIGVAMLAPTIATAQSRLPTSAVLRSEATAPSSVLRLGDIAELTGEDPLEVARLAATPLAVAPPPGETRYLRSGELRDLLRAQGVAPTRLEISGAQLIEVSRSAQQAHPLAGLPGGAEALTEVVAEAIERRLIKVSGHDLWNVVVDRDPQLLSQLVSLPQQFAVQGGTAPWTGRQRLELMAPGLAAPIAVYARITRAEWVVTAAAPIVRGQIVHPQDVQLQAVDSVIPTYACRSLEEVVGHEVRQQIAVGAIVQSSQLQLPIVVRRGETVTVTARAEGIVVKTLAEAREPGGIGELVQVETVDGRRRERFMARVTGRRECEVYAAGVAMSDVPIP